MGEGLEFVGSVTVLKSGSLYRVTVPKKIVDKMGLKAGEKLLVYYDPGRNAVVLVKP
ncbi:AbrB/MazE/SpoVT family DNA-binding domain-containing protein [Desulfurococcaceae archaeon MEX13E-LK6-19]|nr:AbrB/MazE/SpoVT family DNA-binding domain-containing protein [Desulfurococcaceae archaeon MEX13E-LK6-19]